ncbi:hypothetical protein EON82_00725, partial [bacterium]
TADIPMGEFWVNGMAMETIKVAASVGHVYGRRVIGAESFTADEGSGRWLEEPYGQKVMGDRAFCEGVNRYIFHRYAMQPWLDVRPGMTMGPWGSHFDRTQTWWTEAKEWMRYVARCQYILQKGRFVADVAYYYGEDAPVDLPSRPNLRPEIPQGYDYDGVDAGAVRSMTVRNGHVVLPSGMSYSVLVLPESRFMTRAMARKIRDLVDAGATVVGPKPLHTPGLSDLPNAERDLQVIAGNLWDSGSKGIRRYGKGQIITGLSLREVFETLNLKPDFESSGANLAHIHRKIDGADVYFVSNQRYRPAKAHLSFRVDGKLPELWHADTGRIENALAYTLKNGRVELDLDLTPAQSVFVVFRKPAPRTHLTSFVSQAATKTRLPVIQIRKAFYGSADGRGADVTSKVRELVSRGDAEVQASNALFGDPVVNVVKRLTIDYTLDGKPKRIEVAENGDAVLSGAPPVETPTYSATARPDGSLELTSWRAGTYVLRSSDGITKTIQAPAARTLNLSWNWSVAFAPDLGAPGYATFPKLISWPDHSNPGIKYFSGSAVYTRDFVMTKRAGEVVRLDLGTVKNFATVSLNGKTVATLWKPPFALDITPYVKPGQNRLEVKVTNLWPNRIIGDEQLPPEIEWNGSQPAKWPSWLTLGKARIAADRPKIGRITFGTWRYFTKDSPLYPSGLIGPVKIQSARKVIVN